MIRLYLLLAIVMMLWAYWAVPRLQPSPAQWFKSRIKYFVLILVLTILGFLLLTGRLNILIALLGLIGAGLARLLPLLLKYAPYIQRLWQWRQQQAQSGQAYQQARSSNPASMTREQALAILGLDTHADQAAIIDAHRRLMAKLHPDKGGTDYLAAQLNLAKQTLLGS